MGSQQITAGVLDRARGTFFGQAVGDALGTTVEFQTADAIARECPGGLRELIGGGPFRLLAGQVTDDTELALALARSLIDRGTFDDDAVAEEYRKWYRSGPFDVGGTTALAFGTPGEPGPGLAAQMRAYASRTSQANGSLMRQRPLGVFGWRLDEIVLADLSCRDSTLSHPHIACQESCVAFTHAIAFAVRIGASAQDVSSETIRFMSSHRRNCPVWRRYRYECVHRRCTPRGRSRRYGGSGAMAAGLARVPVIASVHVPVR